MAIAHMVLETPRCIWVFPKIMVPQNGWFIMENPIKMDELVVPLFLEIPIYIYNLTLPDQLGAYIPVYVPLM